MAVILIDESESPFPAEVVRVRGMSIRLAADNTVLLEPKTQSAASNGDTTDIIWAPLGISLNSQSSGLTPVYPGELRFPGGHSIALERPGTSQTDLQFWHGQAVAGLKGLQPNMKMAMGTGILINAPTGDANVLQLHQYNPNTSGQNNPMVVLVKWTASTNDIVSFADNSSGSYVYPWRMRSDGSVVSSVKSAVASGIYAGNDNTLTASPTGSTTTQFAGSLNNLLAKGASGSTFGGALICLSGDTQLDPASQVGIAGQAVGVFGAASNNAAGRTMTTGRGVYGVLRNTASGTVTTGTAFNGLIQNTSSGTITTAQGLAVQLLNSGSGSVTTAYGLRVLSTSNTGGGSVGTFYGIYVDSQTAAGTNYSIYVAGGAVKIVSTVDALGYYVNGKQVVTPTGDLAPGSVANAAQFAAGLKPVEVWTYATRPMTGNTADRIIFVTDWPLGGGLTGPRLARWNGTAWVAMVDTSELLGTITTTQITNNAITTGKIAANAITATELAANSVVAGKLAANSVTAGSIQAGAVTATAINVSTLSSITANVGTITAGLLQNSSGTRFLDLSALTTAFLQHEKLTLGQDGSATFSGGINLTASSNAIKFYNGATQVAVLDVSGTGLVRLQNPALTYGLSFISGTANFDAGPGTVNIGVNSNGVLIGAGGSTLGFFATGSPVTKRTVTGTRAMNPALASLLTALAGYGLITDSTTLT